MRDEAAWGTQTYTWKCTAGKAAESTSASTLCPTSKGPQLPDYWEAFSLGYFLTPPGQGCAVSSYSQRSPALTSGEGQRDAAAPTLCVRQRLPLPPLILLQVISALAAEKTQAAHLHTQPRGAQTSKRKCTPSPSALTILLVDLNQGLVGLLCSCQAVLILQGKTG